MPGPAIDEPVAQVTAATVRTYYHTDRQGSVVAMSDASGNLVEGPYVYDAYGNCFVGSTACGSSGQPYRFVGMRLDAETGLYYDRARYYSASLGRFLQTDPVGYTADLNLYAYVGNDPINKSDPTGEAGLGLEFDGFIAGTSGGGGIGGIGVGVSYNKGVLEIGGFSTHGGANCCAGGGVGASLVIMPTSMSAMAGPSVTGTGATPYGAVSGSFSVHSDGHGGNVVEKSPNAVAVSPSGLGGGAGAAVGTTATDLKITSIDIGGAIAAIKQTVADARKIVKAVKKVIQKINDAANMKTPRVGANQ